MKVFIVVGLTRKDGFLCALISVMLESISLPYTSIGCVLYACVGDICLENQNSTSHERENSLTNLAKAANYTQCRLGIDTLTYSIGSAFCSRSNARRLTYNTSPATLLAS